VNEEGALWVQWLGLDELNLEIHLQNMEEILLPYLANWEENECLKYQNFNSSSSRPGSSIVDLNPNSGDMRVTNRYSHVRKSKY